MKEHSKILYEDLNKLLLYRGIAKDKIVKLAMLLMKEKNDAEAFKGDNNWGYELLSELFFSSEKRKIKGNAWKGYILDLVISDENPFSLMCERKKGYSSNNSIYKAAVHDFGVIKRLYKLDIYNLTSISEDIDIYIEGSEENEITCEQRGILEYSLEQEDDLNKLTSKFAAYYGQFGCGIFSKYSAFRFEKGTGLTGIENLEDITFDDLIGVEIQKKALVNNTEAFLSHSPSNNVLLYGDRGTGKSSSVKALLNTYKKQGLRIIEITRHNIECFYEVLDKIKGRGLHFIIFLDDLSFEEFETDYKYLKSVIEGGIEGRPSNVLIYATSNRRHIIKESWGDRGNSVDDINTGESLQEKLSLVDRFGETIIYTSPNKKEYINIVEELALKSGLDIPKDELINEALKWEMWHNGRSGRTAQHFINYLMSLRRQI